MPTFEVPIWETVLRASVVYLILAIALRVIPKRQSGNLSPNDLIALVVIGGLTADAIAGGSGSSPDLLLMIAVVLVWDYALNWLEYHVPPFRRIAQDSPTLLIHDGRVLNDNLRRELMTEEELAANLRKHGVLDIGRVRQAVLEADGEISIVQYDEQDAPRSPPSV